MTESRNERFKRDFNVDIQAILDAIDNGVGGVDLSNYYTKTQIDSNLSGKAEASDLSALEITVADKADSSALTSHTSNTSNPHSTTKAQIGLGSVDNTSDADKPISDATQSALNAKAPLASPAFTGTPTGITKAHVGLGNVDNTADSAKPVSTAQQTALDGKVSKGSIVYNVKDYGALGNGSQNDTTAIQNAIDAASTAGGGVVLFPVGTYIVQPASTSRALTAKSNVTLLGYGATLKIANNNAAYLTIIGNTGDCSNFKMNGLRIDQNGLNNLGHNTGGAGPTNEYRFVLQITAGSKISITDCIFDNCEGVNTLVLNGGSTSGSYGVKNIAITNCHFLNVGTGNDHDHSTIYTQCDGARIENNTFMGRVISGGPAFSYCAIETHGPKQSVIGNQIEGYVSAINFTAASYRADTSVCNGNTMYKCLSGIRVNVQDTSSNPGNALVRGMAIVGNTIYIQPDYWASLLQRTAY